SSRRCRITRPETASLRLHAVAPDRRSRYDRCASTGQRTTAFPNETETMSVASEKTRAPSSGFGETVKIIVQALLLALVVRTFLFQPFSIPSGSMIPTL